MADWQVGDLALGVHGGGRKTDPCFGAREGHMVPRKGGVYHVERVVWVEGVCGLVLAGHHSLHPLRSWVASCFIKVTPDSKIEGADVERRVPVREDA